MYLLVALSADASSPISMLPKLKVDCSVSSDALLSMVLYLIALDWSYLIGAGNWMGKNGPGLSLDPGDSGLISLESMYLGSLLKIARLST